MEIEDRVAALGDLSRLELVTLWQQHYGHPPPTGVRQPLLVRAAAWHLQERVIGGLSTNAKRLFKAALKRAANSLERGETKGEDATISDGLGAVADKISDVPVTSVVSVGDRTGSPRSLPLPGARLIREWNGRRYVVDVIDGGFVMNDKRYRSLSGIALEIIGTKWSGPRFFGL